MNSIVIREKMYQFFTPKILAMIFLLLLFMGYERSLYANTAITYSEFVLHGMTEIYYLSFGFLLPFWVFVFFTFKEETEIALLRFGKRWKYVWQLILAGFLISLVVVAIHLVLLLLLALGLPFQNEFSIVAQDSQSQLYFFKETFSTPLSGIIGASSYMVMGCTTLITLFLILKKFLKEKLLVLLLGCLYVGVTVSTRMEVPTALNFFLLNRYLIFHQGYLFGYGWYFYLLITLGLILFLLSIEKYKFRKNVRELKVKRKKERLTPLTGSLTYWNLQSLLSKNRIVILISWLLLYALQGVFTTEGLQVGHVGDLILTQFYGTSLEEPSLMSLVFYSLYMLIPFYFVGVYLEDRLSDASSILLIRLRDKKKWIYSVIRAIVIFLIGYVLVSFLLSFIVGVGFNAEIFSLIEGTGLSPNGLGIMAVNLYLESFVLLVLEIITGFLFLFSLYCLTKSTTTSFIVILFGYIITGFPFSVMRFSPFSMAAIGRNTGFGAQIGLSFYQSSFLLILYIAILLTYISMLGSKKLFK